MNEYQMLAEKPIFFERNRVYRISSGGALFHDLFGDEAVDGYYPEEWIASCVPAISADSDNPHEGVSRVRGSGIYFDELLKVEPELMLGTRKNFDILVKALDSAMRLPIQAHPDKAFSRKYLNSDYGKAEAWLILATRGDAHICLGFKDKIDETAFIEAITNNETDKSALEALMHKVPVSPGEVYLVPARTVHAIGAGVLLVEIQEPTDFTITPETWCGDKRIDAKLQYLGLDRDIALKCFDYDIYGEHAEALSRKQPHMLTQTEEYSMESLIRYEDTPCFALNRYRVRGSLTLQNAPAVFIVTRGEGFITTAGESNPLKKGDYFFLPFVLGGKCGISAAAGELELIECLPPIQ